MAEDARRARKERIDPATLMRIKSLQLRAKSVVEGFQTGLNRSPFHGFSVEFSEYRDYSPGDDPRYLDWRLYGRTDRHYIRLFEDETNLRCTVLLDLSKSMGYGSLDYTKVDYARTLAATLIYFLTTQRDAVGLATFDENVDEFIPARSRAGHMRRLMATLERQVAGKATDIIRPLEQAAERIKKRGMVVLVSDLLAPLDDLQANLGFLRVRGQEVVVFQILDPAEIDFTFDQSAMFEDVETGNEIYVEPETVRDGYLERLQNHLDTIDQTCDRLGITCCRVRTDEPLENALGEFLRRRMRSRAAGRATAR